MKQTRWETLTSNMKKRTSELETGMLVVLAGGIVKLQDKRTDALNCSVWSYTVVAGHPKASVVAGPDFMLWPVILPVC